jgi:hypothetical protein
LCILLLLLLLSFKVPVACLLVASFAERGEEIGGVGGGRQEEKAASGRRMRLEARGFSLGDFASQLSICNLLICRSILFVSSYALDSFP